MVQKAAATLDGEEGMPSEMKEGDGKGLAFPDFESDGVVCGFGVWLEALLKVLQLLTALKKIAYCISVDRLPKVVYCYLLAITCWSPVIDGGRTGIEFLRPRDRWLYFSWSRFSSFPNVILVMAETSCSGSCIIFWASVARNKPLYDLFAGFI